MTTTTDSYMGAKIEFSHEAGRVKAGFELDGERYSIATDFPTQQAAWLACCKEIRAIVKQDSAYNH